MSDSNSSSMLDLEVREISRWTAAWNRVKWPLLLASFILLIIAITQLPIAPYLVDWSAWIHEHPLYGTVLALLAFFITIPLCLPATLLEAAAGSLFGIAFGVLIICIGKTGGSLIAFLLGRHMGKSVIGGYLDARFPTFRALARVFSSTSSWKPLMLFQMSSIPNLIKCYGLAITDVTPYRFTVSSLVASVPHALLWAYIGSQASDIALLLSGKGQNGASEGLGTTRIVILVIGSLVTALAIGALVAYTRKQMQELQRREHSSDEEDALVDVVVEDPNCSSDDNSIVRHDSDEILKPRITRH